MRGFWQLGKFHLIFAYFAEDDSAPLSGNVDGKVSAHQGRLMHTEESHKEHEVFDPRQLVLVLRSKE